ncbi:WhiB family transcriptional regulator [Streptomyces sp. NPDC002386]
MELPPAAVGEGVAMVSARGHWSEYAACRSSDPDELFVDGNPSQRRAKALCADCEVRIECLAEALDHRIEFGIWGGMTERERDATGTSARSNRRPGSHARPCRALINASSASWLGSGRSDAGTPWGAEVTRQPTAALGVPSEAVGDR